MPRQGLINRVKKKGKMKPHDLESMSVDELWSLYEKASSVLARKIAAEKARLDQRLQRLQQLGLTGATTGLMSGRPYPQVFPKYRNPDQPAETWTGRGKQPRWLTAKLSSGKKLEHFRIQPSKNRARRDAR
jgi:DNA-binding protein H-NS